MESKNDITGDRLVSKPNDKAFEEGWERIFGCTIDTPKYNQDKISEIISKIKSKYSDEQSNPKAS